MMIVFVLMAIMMMESAYNAKNATIHVLHVQTLQNVHHVMPLYNVTCLMVNAYVHHVIMMMIQTRNA